MIMKPNLLTLNHTLKRKVLWPVELDNENKEKSTELIFMIAFPVLNLIMNMITVVTRRKY